MRETVLNASLAALRRFFKKTKPAFSLPEILITTSILGAVSILVLGVANKEITTQMMDTQRTLINNEIAVAVADMQAEGRLAGYKSQEEFNKVFNKFYPFEVIPKSDIIKRFATEYINTNGAKIRPDDYQNKVVTQGGVSFAYTYDTTCNPQRQFSQDSSTYTKVGNNYSYIAKNEALSCIKGFYDINGAKGPNEIGKDVMPLSEFTKDCKDKNGNMTNFIPNAYGNCPNDENKNKEGTLFPAANVCSLTELNCKANGSLKTLDRNSCECVCKLSCPRGETLDKVNCKCSCNTNKIENNICKKPDGTENPYADCDASKDACTCMPKNPNAPRICTQNGGEWSSATCRCTCPDKIKNDVAKKYNNLAEVDANDFCVPKCKYSTKNDAFKTQVNTNATNNGLSDDKIAAITDSSNIEDMCFKCDNSSLEDNTEAIKVTTSGKGGFCRPGCVNPSDAEKNNYKEYFEWLDYDAEDATNSCRWKCKDGDNEGIKKRVKELNNDSKYTTPLIRDAAGNDDGLANFKLAQYHYFEAAALGKARDENPVGSYGDGKDYNIVVNGKTFLAQKVYNCEERGCKAVYDAFKNNNNVFAGFLKYAASSGTAPEYALGWKSGASANDYKIQYKANTEICAIETDGFDFGTSPASQIPYHSAGVDIRKWEMVTFGFEPITNTDLLIKNPNPNFKNIPKEFQDKAKEGQHSDDYWKTTPIGVKISYRTQYDPLALNINAASPNSDPATSARTVSFPLVYNSNGRRYDSINVNWPIENSYRFVVNKNFKDNSNKRNIGNMFSDQYVISEGKQYPTGFDQLAAQYDTDHDNIITRNEMRDKLYLWRQSGATWTSPVGFNQEFTPLEDFVLDINLNKWAVNTDTGSGVQNDKIVYDIQGEYRKIVPILVWPNSKPACGANEVCVKYIGYDRSGINSDLKTYIETKIETTDSNKNQQKAELWQDINNEDVYYYYLRTVNGTPVKYSDTIGWHKISKTELIHDTVASLPDGAVKVSGNNTLNTLDKNIFKAESGETITLYKDSSDLYYVVKEKASENEKQQAASNNEEISEVENSEDSKITTTEITRYTLPGYTNSAASKIDKQYFFNNNKWYSVIVARVTDIIFKYEK